MKVTIVLIIFFALLFGYPLVSVAQIDSGEGYSNAQCVECHEEMVADHTASTHKEIQCLECHLQASEEEHEVLPPVDCRLCHAPHDEKVTHDAHTRVACKACHQKDGVAVADSETGVVIFSGDVMTGRDLSPHQMVLHSGESHCGSCHFQGNDLGASSMILPAKSILCLPCHVATFSIEDRTTLISLFIFVLGMSGVGVVWFSRGSAKRVDHTLSKGLSPLLVAMVIDVLLIKRLYQLSPVRWLIHALIYYAILIRMVFGIMVLVLSLILPETDLAAAMLDKNHPFRALLFDLTGLMLIAGVAGALFCLPKDRESITHLPPAGRTMTLLLGLVVLAGFILEGMRIAMTGWPAGAAYAFMGYGASLLIKGMTGIQNIYGYIWYGHAILTGIFIALIPFTRMLHIITAPVVLITDAWARDQANH